MPKNTNLNNKLDNLLDKIIDIIKNNEADVAVSKISKLTNPSINEKIGKKYALKLYILNSSKSVKYDANKYKNNINLYKNKINENIQKAKDSVNF